jgi:hypothetical protein
MPIWNCGGCNAPWPCPTRKVELRAEFDGAPVSLALYMGSYLVSAAEDLVWIPAGYLHRRFVGWTRAADRDAQLLTTAVQQPNTAAGPTTMDHDQPEQPT